MKICINNKYRKNVHFILLQFYYFNVINNKIYKNSGDVNLLKYFGMWAFMKMNQKRRVDSVGGKNIVKFAMVFEETNSKNSGLIFQTKDLKILPSKNFWLRP